MESVKTNFSSSEASLPIFEEDLQWSFNKRLEDLIGKQIFIWASLLWIYQILQEKIFRRKRLSTGANFVHVYIQIWDKVYLNLFNFSIPKVK